MFLTEELNNIKSGKKELRQFGVSLGIILGLLAGVALIRGKGFYIYFFVLALAFILPALWVPVLLKPIQKIWMSLAILIGWVVSRVILTILFYLVVTPVGILAKLLGKQFLDTKLAKNADSYWIPKTAREIDKQQYENQF